MSVDPRMTIRDPSGPGVSAPRFAFAQPTPFHIELPTNLRCTCDPGQSAYYVRPSSISRSEENTCAPTTRCVDVGPPNYAPAPNHKSVDFCSRGDADPASLSRGISLPSFFEEDLDELMEAADDTPLASTPAAEGNSIVLEFHVRRRFLIDRLSLGAS